MLSESTQQLITRSINYFRHHGSEGGSDGLPEVYLDGNSTGKRIDRERYPQRDQYASEEQWNVLACRACRVSNQLRNAGFIDVARCKFNESRINDVDLVERDVDLVERSDYLTGQGLKPGKPN